MPTLPSWLLCCSSLSGPAEPPKPSYTDYYYRLHSYDAQANLSLLWEIVVRNNRSVIIPGNFTPSQFTSLLFYEPDAEVGEFYTIDDKGRYLLKHNSGWRNSWTLIVPGSFVTSQFTSLLFYDANAGVGEFYTTDGQGNITLLKSNSGWRKTWTLIVPGNFTGGPFTDLLFYDASAGVGEFYTTDGQGNITLVKSWSGWRKSWYSIVPGNFTGGPFTDLLFYDQSAPVAEFYTTDGQGNITLVKSNSPWGGFFSQLLPGNLTSGPFTDILAVDPENELGAFYSTDGHGNIGDVAIDLLWGQAANFVVVLPNAVPAPANGLAGNSNYFLSSNCNPLKNLSVTIQVTEDIVCSSESGGPTPGFSFQVNAYSLPNTQTITQQYFIIVERTALMCGTDNFRRSAPTLIPNDTFVATLPNNATLPAGYKLTLSLQNDASGNVTGFTCVAIDNTGTTVGNVTVTLTSLPGVTSVDLAPIVNFEFNLVGPWGGEAVVLSSGAGIILYSASNVMTVSSTQPSCTPSSLQTVENANTSYSNMPAIPSNEFVQFFNVTAAPSTAT